MNEFELVVNQEEKERNRNELEEKLKKMGITEPWNLKKMLDEVMRNPYDWELDNNFPILTIGETQIIEKSLVKKESLYIELKEIESEMKRLNSRYSLIKQEINNLNNNICEIQGHRLSQINFEGDTDCHGHIIGNYSFRRCFVCGKEIFVDNLTEKDVVVKKKQLN